MTAGKTTMPCPACQEEGSDSSGNHLTVFPSGKFACAVFPGDKVHNRRIIELRTELGNAEIGGKITSDLNGSPSRHVVAKEVAAYPYTDAQGNLVFEVVRFEPKTFRQRRYVDGVPIWNMDGVTRVLYRWPEVIAAETVWCCEGEKDADNLRSLGLVATCNAGGAGKWNNYSEALRGKGVILCGDNDEPGRKHMDKVEAALTAIAKSIRRVTVPAPFKDISDALEGLSDTEAKALIDEMLTVREPLSAMLDARCFDIAKPPAKPTPVLLINSKPIATSGNLVAVTAQAKAGKTALLTAMFASLMDDPSGDCLGLTGDNRSGLPVVHFDTEQSPFDHHAVVLQALRRAGRDKPPDWFSSYSLADVSTKDRRHALAHEMKRRGPKLAAVFLDGTADLCVDPNDPAEAFGLVEELHRLAITHDCPIICVLHENPGSETGKTRGHLGSQLERKAETNLRLSKDVDGVTTIFTERSRHCHIPKEQGPRFAWDDHTGMHVSRGTGTEARVVAKTEQLARIVGDVFAPPAKSALRHKELVDAIAAHETCSERTAKTRIDEAVKVGLIIHQRGLGMYSKGAL